jgi:hypothetical protein
MHKVVTWCLFASLLGCGKANPAGPLTTQVLDGGCAITLESWALAEATHVPVGTALTWESNPPSSGSHFPVWAAFQEFMTPVPRGYSVHDLEHGAIVLLYNCANLDGGQCELIREGLRQVSASLPDDSRCGAGVRVRTVISPDPLLSNSVAASAWGFTWRADCVDLPSLEAFAAAHYARAPEDECANGVTQF